MSSDSRSSDRARGLLDRLVASDRAALSKAITAVETGSATGRQLLSGICDRLGRALVIGITGAPGTGKSTLTSALIGELRRRGKSVGVLAVDPSSPISGGAILGDRLRMAEHAADPEVFIRSLSSRGRLGGLAPASAMIVDVMDAAGKDVVILETVGAGQSEVEIAEIADVRIVVSAPGLGDDIQAMKAGILEIADILVVNKGDLPRADAAAAQLRAMLGLRHKGSAEVPVIVTVATEAHGLLELADLVERCAGARGRSRRRGGPGERLPGLLIREILRQLEARLHADRAALLPQGLLDSLCDGELTLTEAAERWLGPRLDCERRVDDGGRGGARS